VTSFKRHPGFLTSEWSDVALLFLAIGLPSLAISRTSTWAQNVLEHWDWKTSCLCICKGYASTHELHWTFIELFPTRKCIQAKESLHSVHTVCEYSFHVNDVLILNINGSHWYTYIIICNVCHQYDYSTAIVFLPKSSKNCWSIDFADFGQLIVPVPPSFVPILIFWVGINHVGLREARGVTQQRLFFIVSDSWWN